MKHRGRCKFGELLDHLIDNEIIKFGEIHIYVTNDIGEYQKYIFCGLGTFTGIGYQYLLAPTIVDSFTIDFCKGEKNICTFYLSIDEV